MRGWRHGSHGGPQSSLRRGSSRSLGMRGHQSYLKQLRASSSSPASLFLGMSKVVLADQAPFSDFSKSDFIFHFFFSTAAVQESSMITSPRYKRLTAYVLYLDEWTLKSRKNCRSSARMWPQLKTGKLSESLLSEGAPAHSRKWSCGGDIRPAGVKVT